MFYYTYEVSNFWKTAQFRCKKLLLRHDIIWYALYSTFGTWNSFAKNSKTFQKNFESFDIPFSRLLRQVCYILVTNISKVSLRCLIWIWIRRLWRPVDGGIYFMTRINLGTILVWFLVLCSNILGCSLSACSRTSGLRRNSPNFDKAHRTRPFVLWNSWDSFSASLPSTLLTPE